MAEPGESEFQRALGYAVQRVQKTTFLPKPEQTAAIRAIYQGRDVFVWLPTGFGKSFCYEAIPFVLDWKLKRTECRTSSSLVLIVSPLVALMVDQVRSLRTRGVKAAIISGGAGEFDEELLAKDTDLDECSLLFGAPEAFLRSKWRDTMEKPSITQRIVAVVIDEAHCVTMWSKEFRPSYGRLHELRALVPENIPYLACTATVTKSVRQEIIRNLDMTGCDFVFTSPDRENIYYEVKARTDIESDMAPLVQSLQKHLVQSPKVIIYCQSLNMCADLYSHFVMMLGDDSYYPAGAEKLLANRLFGMFHSRTTEHNKQVLLDSLTMLDGTVRVVFATSALGMGVNLVGVNTIIHYGAPSSIDDYFQGSGRGGRSGEKARSIVFWTARDCPMKKVPRNVRDHEVAAVRHYLENETVCRRKWLLEYFDNSLSLSGCVDSEECCDICTSV